MALLAMLFIFCLHALMPGTTDPRGAAHPGLALFSLVFGNGAAPELLLWVRVGLNQERVAFYSNLMSLSP